jgi:hypothetical protein
VKCETKMVTDISKELPLEGSSPNSFESEYQQSQMQSVDIAHKKRVFLYATNGKITQNQDKLNRVLTGSCMLISNAQIEAAFAPLFNMLLQEKAPEKEEEAEEDEKEEAEEEEEVEEEEKPASAKRPAPKQTCGCKKECKSKKCCCKKNSLACHPGCHPSSNSCRNQKKIGVKKPRH